MVCFKIIACHDGFTLPRPNHALPEFFEHSAAFLPTAAR